jgi:hypothetical protein
LKNARLTVQKIIIKEPEKAPVLPGLSFIGNMIFLNLADNKRQLSVI